MGTKEFIKSTKIANGFVHLLFNIIWIAAIILIAKQLFMSDYESAAAVTTIIGGIIWIFDFIGFTLIQPNSSVVLTFFGKYSGTVKHNGFYWFFPLYGKKKLSLRARNMDVKPIKVNDKTGNPIMIGLVLVWKIQDTYKACFEIDAGNDSYTQGSTSKSLSSYEGFVKIQSDAALRKTAGLYAYDNLDHNNDNEITLRSGGEEINNRLEEELTERLAIAGIIIIEARINYLAYASEIANVMLRRQQADAIIAAREKIVEGAVSMVDLALKKLDEQHVVELNNEKKAEMVCNLLVVLCADEAASPVINTGANN